MVDASEAARVRRALASLPSQQRATLERTFFAGLSYPEIAAKENLPLGTIKSRAARALTAPREALEKDWRQDWGLSLVIGPPAACRRSDQSVVERALRSSYGCRS